MLESSTASCLSIAVTSHRIIDLHLDEDSESTTAKEGSA
jgi:hypothetical protein